MISVLSKIMLLITLVTSLILICGCTGTEVVSLDSPGASSSVQASPQAPTYVPTASPTPVPTAQPTPVPTPTPTDTPVPSSQKPFIVSATTDKATYTVNNEQVTLTIVAGSDSAVKGYSLRLDGPDGNILDGPAQVDAKPLGNGQWSCDMTFFTYTTLAPGDYTWSQIRVVDSYGQWSDYGPAVSFEVTG